MATSREIRFYVPEPYGAAFDRLCASYGMNQRDAFIWLLSPHETAMRQQDNPVPTTQPLPQTTVDSDTKREVAHWKRDEPLTRDEIAEMMALNKRDKNREPMQPIERTKLYAYVERYTTHNKK